MGQQADGVLWDAVFDHSNRFEIFKESDEELEYELSNGAGRVEKSTESWWQGRLRSRVDWSKAWGVVGHDDYYTRLKSRGQFFWTDHDS